MHLLIVGNSHTAALRAGALNGNLGIKGELLQLPRSPYRELLAAWSVGRPLPEAIADRLADPRYDAVVLSIKGNVHNVFSLVSHPEPFDFHAPGGERPPASGAWIVSYGLVRRSIETLMKSQLALQDGCVAAARAPVVVVSAPPAFPQELVLSHAGGFNERIAEKGASPEEFRVKCWDIQQDVGRQWSAKRGIPYIEVPSHLLTPGGALDPQYCNRSDCTHGNTAFGVAMMAAVAEKLRGIRAAA